MTLVAFVFRLTVYGICLKRYTQQWDKEAAYKMKYWNLCKSWLLIIAIVVFTVTEQNLLCIE